jgi:hypothetical protein
LPTGKRQHQPPIICHLDWSGRVQGGLTSEADVTRAVSQLPPSKAGRCVVKITCDQQPGTIEIQSYSWGMSQTGTASMGGGLSQGKLIRRAVLQATSGAVVATSDPDPSGRVLFTGVPPGEYRLLLTNEDGRTVTLSDWNGDGRSDLVIQGDGAATGKVAVQDLSVTPRDVSTGQASGKRQHKPFACLVDWSGKVQGGFASNAEAYAIGRALPPSSAGRCIVQVTLEPQPGTIEVRSSWDLKSAKK